MAGFYIDIRSIDEYARYLSKYVTNLADLVVAMKADTLKTEEQWKDKIYKKTSFYTIFKNMIKQSFNPIIFYQLKKVFYICTLH